MTNNGTAQATPTTTPPHEQNDGRVLVAVNEYTAATSAMAKLANEEFVDRYIKTRQTGTTTATDAPQRFILEGGLCKLLDAALRAINTARLGDPEGTICVHHETGKMARRYWSDANNALRWLVVDPATDGDVEIEGVEELHAIDERPWTRVLPQDWPIHLGTDRFRQGTDE